MEYYNRRKKTKKLNVAVIGSGASALGVIKTLLAKKNINITVISKNIDAQNVVFEKKIKSNNKNIRSNFDKPLLKFPISKKYSFVNHISSGGLSDYWSGSLAIPDKLELKKWGLDKLNFDKYYKTLSKIIPISGEKNNRNHFLPNKYINEKCINISSILSSFLDNFKKNKNLYISKNFVSIFLTKKNSNNNCISCTDCFNGCIQDSIFRPSKEINKLIKNGYVEYINQNVNKININKKNRIKLNKKNKSFDKIYLCAGAVATAKIIMKSLGFPKKKLFIYDIPSHTYACIQLFNNQKFKSNFFGFSNLAIKLNMKNIKNYILCGNLPSNIFKKIFKINFISRIIKNIITNRVFYLQIFGDQNNYHSLYFDKKYNLKIMKLCSFNSKSILKKLNRFFLNQGFYIPLFFKLDNSSAHYSSNLFDAYNTGDNIRGIFKKNLYICDSSVFNAPSSSSSHTFFLMANACRIAKLSVKQ